VYYRLCLQNKALEVGFNVGVLIFLKIEGRACLLNLMECSLIGGSFNVLFCKVEVLFSF
jgi:hypothetical protein